MTWTMVAGDFVTTGGMDRANYALASFLARNGHPVDLVGHRVAPDLAEIPDVTFRAVSKPLGSYFLGRWLLRRAGRRAGNATRASGGRVVVNGGNCTFPDINWVHYIHAAYRSDVTISRVRRLKTWIERPMELRAERTAVRAARVVVCNSERTRRDAIEKLGVSSERAVTVYYGTDAERFYPAAPNVRAALRARLGWSDARPVVLFIGALGDRRKGFDTLFAAWQMLCSETSWDAVLVVVGRGAELAVWETRVAEAGLTDRVRFLGFRSDVPDLLRAADALVHPARYEAYGLGVHEALCCGLPAVVSAVAGVAERYPPDLADLLLTDPESPAELAARLRYWRANRSRSPPASARSRSGCANTAGTTWAATSWRRAHNPHNEQHAGSRVRPVDRSGHLELSGDHRRRPRFDPRAHRRNQLRGVRDRQRDDQGRHGRRVAAPVPVGAVHRQPGQPRVHEGQQPGHPRGPRAVRPAPEQRHSPDRERAVAKSSNTWTPTRTSGRWGSCTGTTTRSGRSSRRSSQFPRPWRDMLGLFGVRGSHRRHRR